MEGAPRRGNKRTAQGRALVGPAVPMPSPAARLKEKSAEIRPIRGNPSYPRKSAFHSPRRKAKKKICGHL